ncbi:MAG: N-(5'-phosphoribosyl)anthranilate isomerase [Chloroflexi bacterium]|nr:N-(5'-phosphoribosyl)anthranilate isomerase [Chloroflexota bacterium]
MNKNETKIKICGIRDTNIIEKISKLEIDFLGLNFIENSKRYIQKDTALEISKLLHLTNNKINLVGLFQDHEINHVNKITELINLDFVQLCGKESVEYINSINTKVLKVIHIKPSHNIQEVEAKINKYLSKCEYVILDTFSKKSSGGTGEVFNWEKYSSLFSKKVFVAGGLNHNNISKIVNLHNPWGVDVSSGVETDGNKDIDKIKKFINNCNS